MLHIIFFLTLSSAYAQRFQPPTEDAIRYAVPGLFGRPLCPAQPSCDCAQPDDEFPVPPVPHFPDGAENMRARTGWYLAVDPNKREVFGIRTVGGSRTKPARLRVQKKRRKSRVGRSAEDVYQSAVTIQEAETNLYVAMDNRGDVYAESRPESHNIWWQQSYDEEGGGWYRYTWLGNNASWFLGIQRGGRTSRGGQTDYGQSAVQWARDTRDTLPALLPDDSARLGAPKWESATLENPSGGMLVQSRTGFNLALNEKFEVFGEEKSREGWARSHNSVMLLRRRPSPFWHKDVQIQGNKTKTYVAMNDQGYVYAEVDGTSENTWWKVAYVPEDRKYVTFQWLGNNKGWFLAIEEGGLKMKRGTTTNRRQPSAQFLLRLGLVERNR